MMKYNWKEDYYDVNGVFFTASGRLLSFATPLTDGDGSRSNPYDLKKLSSDLTGVINNIVVGSGYAKCLWDYTTNTGQFINIIGNGNLQDTFLEGHASLTGWGSGNITFQNVTVKMSLNGTRETPRYRFKNCDLRDITIVGAQIDYIVNSIVRNSLSFTGTNQSNSFIGIDNYGIHATNLNLYEKCKLNITSQNISQYASLYMAFNDCEFLIGNESDYQPLNGNTEAELRADFVTRCEAQGISCPWNDEYGDKAQMYRWVFAKSSSFEGVVLADSIIHNFEKRRFIYFGYTSLREGFSVTATTKKNSFGMYYPYKNLLFSDSGMSFPSWIDISTKVNASATSNIMWLGGKKALTKLELIHNFPKEYGVNVDSTPTIGDEVGTGDITKDEYFIVRSANSGKSTVYYNGAYYTSSLTERNNIFKGVDGSTGFTDVYGNAKVFKILDEIQYQTIQMRIVNKIPSEIITQDKTLDNGYWYLVEHDTDQSNTTDYVTCGGKNYYVGESLNPGATNFVANGNVHLRRCWFTNFNYDTEAKDKAFWENEQKPEWIEVTPDDMFCLM
ncbi:MAG: hypothetical protein E6767_20715, partial [Dysgonomonas sp.]|nr:hypothetical protein [Dysgonomonas sp.]